MPPKSRFAALDATTQPLPFCGPTCRCLADFFREEFIKHHRCLEQQREFYSEHAISQAEEALRRILARVEQLSQREDACEVVSELLRKFDLITNLSAWSDPETLH
jgi:hypothetical protein